MSQVAEYGVEDQTRAHAEEARADDGDDPVYAFEVTCPTEPEEGDGEGESSHTRWGQLALWGDEAVLVEMSGLVEVFVDEIAWDCDAEDYDEDSEE